MRLRSASTRLPVHPVARALILGWLLWFVHFTTFAFPASDVPQYISQAWMTEDGLPDNCVQGIAQTPDGYLWIATHEGLARFDGVRFSAVDAQIVPAVKSRSFLTLIAGRDGSLWTTTADGRLIRFKDGTFSEVPLAQLGVGPYVMSLFESRDGALWLGMTTNGLARWKDGQLTRWTEKEGLAHFSVRAMCDDAEGNLWIGTGAGLDRWRDGNFQTFSVADGLLHNSVRAVFAEEKGDLWIGSHYGLTRWNATNRVHFTKKEGLADNIVTTVLKDSAGQFWVGTFNGLNRIVGTNITTELHEGRPHDRVFSLFEDREANIWVGTKDGLYRMKPRVVSAYTQQQGLTQNTATSVLEDRSGNLWVGFWGGGVNKIENGKVTTFGVRDGLTSEWVLTMHRSRRGHLWFGMDYDGGMTILRNDGFRSYRQNDGLDAEGVKVFEDDSRTNLWVGTRTALFAFHDGTFRRFTTTNGLPSDTIEAIHEDAGGRLWIGTTGGLVVRDEDEFTAYTTKDGLSHNSISAIYQDADDVLWLGTRGGGLVRVTYNLDAPGKVGPAKPQFTCYTTRDGLFSDDISGVAEDDLGFLWMGSRRGIFRVNKMELDAFAKPGSHRLTCLSFDKSDGMASVECRGSHRTAAWKGRDGRIWFPTSKGIVAIDPQRIRANSMAPVVMIESIVADKRVVSGENLRGMEPGSENNVLTIAPGKGELEFRYTALNFTAPEKLRFRYKLEGLDDDWIEAANAREVRYSHVPHGTYQFRVRAANSDGVWSEKDAFVSLTLTPPFWKTSWFLSLIGLAFVGLTAGTARYVSVRKLRVRLEEIERRHAVEKERMRIAQDMHDELGARMTEIMLLSDFTAHAPGVSEQVRPRLGKLSKAAREVVRNLDAIVWTVNPENDSLERVIGYIHEFAQTYLDSASIRCWFDIPDVLPNRPMASDLRHHLFSVVKESLNNIVKHSGATEARITIHLEGSSLTIAIEDNGKGFSMDDVSSFGNGLKNMKRRMSSVGAKLTMQSAPGKGTQVRVSVDIESLF